MQNKELIDELEQKREQLKKVILNKNMELNNRHVLALSRELDKLIEVYLRTISMDT